MVATRGFLRGSGVIAKPRVMGNSVDVYRLPFTVTFAVCRLPDGERSLRRVWAGYGA